MPGLTSSSSAKTKKKVLEKLDKAKVGKMTVKELRAYIAEAGLTTPLHVLDKESLENVALQYSPVANVTVPVSKKNKEEVVLQKPKELKENPLSGKEKTKNTAKDTQVDGSDDDLPVLVPSATKNSSQQKPAVGQQKATEGVSGQQKATGGVSGQQKATEGVSGQQKATEGVAMARTPMEEADEEDDMPSLIQVKPMTAPVIKPEKPRQLITHAEADQMNTKTLKERLLAEGYDLECCNDRESLILLATKGSKIYRDNGIRDDLLAATMREDLNRNTKEFIRVKEKTVSDKGKGKPAASGKTKEGPVPVPAPAPASASDSDDMPSLVASDDDDDDDDDLPPLRSKPTPAATPVKPAATPVKPVVKNPMFVLRIWFVWSW